MSDTPPDGTPAQPPGDEPTRLDHQPIVVPAPAPGIPAGGSVDLPPAPPPADGDGDGGPPWPWIIGGLVALIVVVVIVLLLTGGDDGGDDDEVGLEPIPGETTTTTSTTTTTTSTTTTAPVTTTTTTTAPATTTTDAPPVTADPAQCEAAGANPDAPEPAAQAVFVAWTRGDENCAAQLMTPAARVELFSRDGSQATDIFQGCDEVEEPDPHTDCAFTFEGGATHYLMNFSPTDGWTVFDITQFAD